MIKCIIFDLNGTIVSTTNTVRKHLAAEGYDNAKLFQLSGFGLIGKAYVIGEITYETYLQKAKEFFPKDYQYIAHQLFYGKTPIHIHKETFRASVMMPYHLNVSLDTIITNFPSMLDIIAILKSKYPLCLFSGTSQKATQAIEEEYHLLQYFTYKVFSYEVGFDKPSDAMFNRLQQTLPFLPQECLLIDDAEAVLTVAKFKGYNIVSVKDLRM